MRGYIGFRFLPSGVLVKAPSASLASVVELLSRFTEQPVVDMTGLDGQYEIDLTFLPETTRSLTPAGTVGPDGREVFSEPGISLSDALSQYGLKLERRKAPIEILTVTHLERTPMDN